MEAVHGKQKRRHGDSRKPPDKCYIAIPPESAKLPTVFPRVYEKLVGEYQSLFVRLYGAGYPDSKDIARFEADLNDNMSHLRSFIASDASEQLDLWGSSKLILRSAESKCPESTSSEGLPTVSHVYLELVIRSSFLRRAFSVMQQKPPDHWKTEDFCLPRRS